MTSRNYVSELWRIQNDLKRSGFQDEFPTTRDLSLKEMEARFKGVLGKVGVLYSSLTVGRIEERVGGIEGSSSIKISIDGQKNIRLTYNPDMLRYLTVKEVESLLYHEACHAVALPSTYQPYQDVGVPIPLITDYYDCYSEYTAHVEFVKRYKGTEVYDGLRKVHLRFLDNIETTMRIFKWALDSDPSVPLGEDVFQMLGTFLLSIVYDSMFFFVAGDDAFLDRCRSLNVVGLHGFVKWVYEDFEYIRNLGLPLETMMDAVIFSGRLSCCVEPRFLMFNGKILFYQDIQQFIQIGARENVKWAIDLAAAWRKRVPC